MALLMMPCPTANTFCSGKVVRMKSRNSDARLFNASRDSISSGHGSSLRSGIYLPVKPPQSLSLNKGVVITSFPWGSAMIEAVSNDRFKSLETMASNCSTARFFATVRACSMPFALSSPCVCDIYIFFATKVQKKIAIPIFFINFAEK